jgi:hypothetical protein
MKKEWENAPNDDLKEVYLRRLVSKGNKIAGLQETEVRLLRQKEKDSSRLQEKKMETPGWRTQKPGEAPRNWKNRLLIFSFARRIKISDSYVVGQLKNSIGTVWDG